MQGCTYTLLEASWVNTPSIFCSSEVWSSIHIQAVAISKKPHT